MKNASLIFILYIALLGAWLANEAVMLGPRHSHLPDSVDSQSAILARRPFVFEGQCVDYPVWRNRLAIPVAMETLARLTPLTHSQAYLLLRWLTACIALCAFASLLHHCLQGDIWFTTLGLAIFALVLGPTFLHVYDIPSDFLDASAMALLTQFTLQRRSFAFILVFFLALLNREGALFALLPWFFINTLPLKTLTDARRLIAPCFLGMAGVGLVQGLRWFNATPQTSTPTGTIQPLIPMQTHVDQFVSGLFTPNVSNPLYYLFGFIALFGLLLRHNWAILQTAERRLAWIAAGVASFTVLFGNIIELRTQMAALVWLTFLSLSIVRRQLTAAPIPSPSIRPA